MRHSALTFALVLLVLVIIVSNNQGTAAATSANGVSGDVIPGQYIGTVAGQAEPKVKVLIGFTQRPGRSEEALVRQAGGDIKYTYHLVPAIAASVPESAIDGLRKNPRVRYIEEDGFVYANDAELDNAWGVKRIGAGTVHAGGNTGAGVKVAIIDSGIDCTHPDLDANCAGGKDFVNGLFGATKGKYKDAEPYDDNGHGTHVAGAVAAENNGVGVVGVAPEARLYALKVMNSSGGGSLSDVIAGIQWATGLNGGTKVDIINMSLGTCSDSQSLRDAVSAVCAAGVLVVASAGNGGNCSGTDSVRYPAKYPEAIAVASTGRSDQKASSSSTGPDVELAAPGVGINSTVPTGSCTYCDDSGHKLLSGTSMASPHVAGTAALVLAANPGWTNVQIRGQLQSTADDLGQKGRDALYGYGLVDADGAAVSTGPSTTGSISGTVKDTWDSSPIGAATVSVDTGQSTTTAPDGSYTLTGVPAGERSVTASASGFEQQTRPATVYQDQITPAVNFALTASDGGSDGGPPPCKGKNKKDSGCP